jgi:hypothetical protein
LPASSFRRQSRGCSRLLLLQTLLAGVRLSQGLVVAGVTSPAC